MSDATLSQKRVGAAGCACAGPGWCERYQKLQGRRHHQICQGIVLTPEACASYRETWLELMLRNGATVPRSLLDCPHRGELGEPRVCGGCPGRTLLKTYVCRHPKTPATVTIRDCQSCPFRPQEPAVPHHHELTTEQPIAWVKQLFQQPPGPWPAQWEGFPNVLQAFHELFKEASENVPPAPAFSRERGIVICGGGWKFFPSIYVTVRMIRHVGCTLPIQVWYLGDRGEFDMRMHDALADFDVGWVCGNNQWRTRPEIPIRRLNFDGDHPGWMLKPFAAAFCPFREVLFLDADSYPIYNPETFMNHPEYQRVGAAFFPDNKPLEPGQWERFGLPGVNTIPSLESGQFFVDKSRHWGPLWVSCWLNAYYDFVYRHVYGDKDTFGLAWKRCGQEMCIPQVRPGWMRHTFLQKDFSGRVLFHHRTRDKFKFRGTVDGIGLDNRYMTRQHESENIFEPRLPFEKECFAFKRECEELIQPEQIFKFVGDGGTGRGWCRDIWDAVFFRNEYRLGREFKRGAVAVDVGAHVGAFARACLRRGAAHVLCVEPLPVNLAALKHNLGDFGHERVTVLEAAVWDEAGRDELGQVPIGEDSCHVPGNSSTATVVGGRAAQRVPAIGFDDVLLAAAAKAADGRIDMLKIDAEGAEYPAILTSQQLGLVEQITGETHEGVHWRDAVHYSSEVFERLTESGFAVSATRNGPNTYLFWAKRA